jgi:hypothetical protein
MREKWLASLLELLWASETFAQPKEMMRLSLCVSYENHSRSASGILPMCRMLPKPLRCGAITAVIPSFARLSSHII